MQPYTTVVIVQLLRVARPDITVALTPMLNPYIRSYGRTGHFRGRPVRLLDQSGLELSAEGRHQAAPLRRFVLLSVLSVLSASVGKRVTVSVQAQHGIEFSGLEDRSHTP